MIKDWFVYVLQLRFSFVQNSPQFARHVRVSNLFFINIGEWLKSCTCHAEDWISTTFVFKNLGWIDVLDLTLNSDLGQVILNLCKELSLQKLFVEKVFLDLLPRLFFFVVCGVSFHPCFIAPRIIL